MENEVMFLYSVFMFKKALFVIEVCTHINHFKWQIWIAEFFTKAVTRCCYSRRDTELSATHQMAVLNCYIFFYTKNQEKSVKNVSNMFFQSVMLSCWWLPVNPENGGSCSSEKLGTTYNTTCKITIKIFTRVWTSKLGLKITNEYNQHFDLLTKLIIISR